MEKRFHKFADVKVYFYLCKSLSGFSAVGSAHVWGARGRWFESSNPDLFEDKGLKFSPLSFVGGLEVGEKSVSIYPQFID